MAQTKSKSKGNKVLNWLKPTSPRKVLLFAIVFGIVGGGIYAYKSSAAGLVVLGPGIVPVRGAYHSTDCSGDKGCVEVVKLPANHDIHNSATATGLIHTNFAARQTVFLCAHARAQSVGNIEPSLILDDANRISKTAVWGLPLNINKKIKPYSEYCTSAVIEAGPRDILPQAENFNTGSEIYISSFSLRW